MIKKVLIVDDDQEMLLSLKDGLEKYNESFSISMASDGQIALDRLKKHPISLVVTDLKMPKINGFVLLSHIMENYPDIPAIIITAYSTPEMEKRAHESGAVGYIEKPFMIDDLAKKIITTLRKESEGGTLHGVSSGMFLQLIEVEQKSCTIRLTDKSSNQNGVLFFKNGELYDARTNTLQGKDAALDIFSWDNVTLSIQNDCPIKEKKIQGELQAILLDAMRMKDEAKQKHKDSEILKESEKPAAIPNSIDISKDVSTKIKDIETKSDNEPPLQENIIEILRNKINNAFGQRNGIIDIYHDKSWDGLLKKFSLFNKLFDSGELKICYLDIGQNTDFILLPDKSTTVLTVNPKCPKDRLIQTLVD